MSTVVYELNEIPKKLFDFYAKAFPESAFALLRKKSNLFETVAADVGCLSPWITWPTMHRGVSNVDHEISDLGQDLTRVNNEFPATYNILAKGGVKVGVFGSLQSYPLPENLDNFCFYVPDTFAAGDESFPPEVTVFQAFNLSMVRKNGRNVNGEIVVKDAANFLRKSFGLGLSSRTLLKLLSQIGSERINKDRLVRRRTSQGEIAFDLYLHQLKKSNPDISFFFTNHLASSMHRYWPTIFPKDYEEGRFDKNWLMRWSGEIPHAVKVANFQLQKLINYCNMTGSDLVVCSSMGQDAVRDVEPIRTQILITKPRRLMSYLGLLHDEYELKLTMAPRVVLSIKSEAGLVKLNRLKNLTVNGEKISISNISRTEVRLDIKQINQKTIKIFDSEKSLEPSEVGIENVKLQDESGSYAYHIPEGILLHYCPTNEDKLDTNIPWRIISVLDFAPSILNKYGVNVPSYMKGENLFV